MARLTKEEIKKNIEKSKTLEKKKYWINRLKKSSKKLVRGSKAEWIEEFPPDYKNRHEQRKAVKMKAKKETAEGIE